MHGGRLEAKAVGSERTGGPNWDQLGVMGNDREDEIAVMKYL